MEPQLVVGAPFANIAAAKSFMITHCVKNGISYKSTQSISKRITLKCNRSPTCQKDAWKA